MKHRFSRRAIVAGAAATLLAGCDSASKSKSTQGVFDFINRLTYRTQRLLIGANRLAPEFSEADIAPVFKPNGSIDPKPAAYRRHVAQKFADWRLEVGGLVERPAQFTLGELRRMPARKQITRHDCVEGWSCIGQWTGAPLAHVLDLVGPKPEARFVVFHCADSPDRDADVGEAARNSLQEEPDPYYETIDLVDARHPQTILAYELNGQALPVANGAPLRVRVERQLGYKMAKYIMKIELIESFADIGGGKGGYWEDRGYDWYAGI